MSLHSLKFFSLVQHRRKDCQFTFVCQEFKCLSTKIYAKYVKCIVNPQPWMECKISFKGLNLPIFSTWFPMQVKLAMKF